VTPKECGKKLMRDYHKGGRWDTESYHLADAIAAEIQAVQAEARKQALEEVEKKLAVIWKRHCPSVDDGLNDDRKLAAGYACRDLHDAIRALAKETK